MAAETGILFALVTLLSWGAADFFAKIAVNKVGHVVSLVLNQLVALGPIFAYAALSSKLPELTLGLVLTVIATGFLSFVGYFYFYRGMRKGKLSIVSPVAGSWFVVTILVTAFFFEEKLLILQIVGIIVIFVGVFLASTNLTQLRHDFGNWRVGGISDALIAMIAWGFAFALIKQVVAVAGPIMALLLIRVVAFLSMSTWIGVSRTKISFPTKTIFAFLAAAALLDAFGYTIYNTSVQTEYVSIVSPIAASYPMVTILLSRIFLKEKLTRFQQCGVTIILVGLVLILLL